MSRCFKETFWCLFLGLCSWCAAAQTGPELGFDRVRSAAIEHSASPEELRQLTERINKYEVDRKGITNANNTHGRWAGGFEVIMVRLRVPRDWDDPRAANSKAFGVGCVMRMREDLDEFMNDLIAIAPAQAETFRTIEQEMWLDWYLTAGTRAPWPFYEPSHFVRFDVPGTVVSVLEAGESDIPWNEVVNPILSEYRENAYRAVRELDGFMAEQTVIGESREQLNQNGDVAAYANREVQRFAPIRHLLTLQQVTLNRLIAELPEPVAERVSTRVLPQMFGATSDQSPILDAIATLENRQDLDQDEQGILKQLRARFFAERPAYARRLLGQLKTTLTEDALREHFLKNGHQILLRQAETVQTESVHRFTESEQAWLDSFSRQLKSIDQ